MQNAIDLVNNLLDQKACWNVQELQEALLLNVYMSAQFTNEDQHIAFGQALHNFECYAKEHKLTSIGRKQFKKWFNVELQNQIVLSAQPNYTKLSEADSSEAEKLGPGILSRSTRGRLCLNGLLLEKFLSSLFNECTTAGDVSWLEHELQASVEKIAAEKLQSLLK